MKPGFLTLLVAVLSCAPGPWTPVFEPSYPSGEGWRCFHALPPAEPLPHHTFQGYATGSRCARSQSECEQLRAEALTRTTVRWSARFRPAEPTPADLELARRDGQICAIDPSACPTVDSVHEVRPAGFSACEERPEAACTAWYREDRSGQGELSWNTTCFATAAECATHLEGWYLHTVHRPCVVLR